MKNGRIGALIGLFAVVCVVVGVLVWPTPKAAMAVNLPFVAILDWDLHQPEGQEDEEIDSVTLEFFLADLTPVAAGGNLNLVWHDDARSEWRRGLAIQTTWVYVRITAHSNTLEFDPDENGIVYPTNFSEGNTVPIHVLDDE